MRPSIPSSLTLVALVAVAALFGAASGNAARPPVGEEAGVLTLGSRGPAVRALQRELRSRGLRVAADGVFGARTRLSVARLQKRLGLRVNGLVDRPLLWWLGMSVCDLPGPTTARGGARGALRLGAFGPKVCALLSALARSGADVAVDGGYGPQTRSAVRSAQRRLGLRANGVAGAQLLARLRSPSQVPPPGPLSAVPLALGARGPGVRSLQVALRRRGHAVSVDGVYGPRTRRAVARAQRRLSLRVNGEADADLVRRLGALRAARFAAFPVSGPHSFHNDFGAPRHQGRHEGNDIVAPRGAPLVAVNAGTIERLTRRERGLGGIWLWLRDDGGTAYYYAHLSQIAPGLAPGVRVAAGQTIGAVGRTGDARGGVYHLHFEMHPRGLGAVNPFAALRAVAPVTPV